MKLSKALCTLAALAATSSAAYAQFDSTDTISTAVPTAAWDNFKLNPKTRVQLDFRNATVDSVIHTLSQASGITIIKDPTLTGGITLQSPKPQSLDDAFAMFNAVLNLKNFQIIQQFNFLLIKAKPQQGGFPRGNNTGFGNTGDIGARSSRGGTQSVLRVYPVEYASATDLAKTINDLYANSGNEAAAAVPGAPGGPGGFGGFGGGGGRRGFGGGGGAGGNAQSVVKASADDFSNSLLVNAPLNLQTEIAGIIRQVDRQTSQPQVSAVYKLKFATSANLVSIVQNVLSGTTPVGRGSNVRTTNAAAASNQQPRFGFFGGGGNSNNTANGTVSADTLSNSLVVTATSQTQLIVADVIAKLDKPALYESTSFVYSLQNARADVVANLLNESFGNRTTNGPVGGSLTSTGTTQPTVSSTRTSTTTGSSSSPSTLGSNTTSGNNNNNNNQNISRSGSTSASSTGYDENGQVVNIRDLTNEVVLVPNIDTNSVIVVTNPENWPIIKNILQQLDQIPEQVMIQTLVVEATLNKSDQFGVEWTFGQGSAFGLKNTTGSGGSLFGLQSAIPQPTLATSTNPASPGGEITNTVPSGLTYTLSGPGYTAFLQALKTDTNFNILSTPRIFTTNNATAQINISQSLPYITSLTEDPTSGELLTSYAFLDVGIVLTVTPRITSNGYVTMDVDQTANEYVGPDSLVQNAPIVNQREATTTVSVKDGETIVLGGIMQNQVTNTVNKVPVLGDLPLIGNLFRSSNKSTAKTELLVFLTPHVIRDPEEARKLEQETYNGMSASSKAIVKIPTPPLDSANPASPNTNDPRPFGAPPIGGATVPALPGQPQGDQTQGAQTQGTQTQGVQSPLTQTPGAQTTPSQAVQPQAPTSVAQPLPSVENKLPIPGAPTVAQPQVQQPQVPQPAP